MAIPRMESWTQGRLLLTPITSRWSQEERDRVGALERLQVFEGFTTEDCGRGRVRICACREESRARQIVAMRDLMVDFDQYVQLLDAKPPRWDDARDVLERMKGTLALAAASELRKVMFLGGDSERFPEKPSVKDVVDSFRRGFFKTRGVF